MLVDSATKTIKVKVVYHGIAMSGKTTNIDQLAQKEGLEVLSFDTKQERTLVFDFMTKKVNLNGFTLSFSLYTIPGQSIYKDIRRMVMRGADGVVFVVDSSERRLGENKQFIEVLAEDLKAYGKDIEDTPLVIQFNKRDLPDALPTEILAKEISIPGKRYTEAVAVNGKGVEETFEVMKEELTKKFSRMVG